MIIGTGCDITDITRIERALARFGAHFSQKILTLDEQKSAHGKPSQYLAGRFAAKEAAVKALGTGFRRGIWFTEIQILTNPLGAPTLSFLGKAASLTQELGVLKTHVSISHEQHYALAFVVLEGN